MQVEASFDWPAHQIGSLMEDLQFLSYAASKMFVDLCENSKFEGVEEAEMVSGSELLPVSHIAAFCRTETYRVNEQLKD
jgi:hypothetical protein